MDKKEGLGKYFVRDRRREEGAAVSSSPPQAKPAAVKIQDKKTDRAALIDALLNGKELVTEIDTDYGVFEFRYPSGGDQLDIAHRRAAYLGGYPDSAYDAARRIQFEQWATLDVLISKKPELFAKVESWADCPDVGLVSDLYDRGARFCGEIRERIRGPGPGNASQGGEAGNT